MPAINCQQVFTILTRGPFPTGESTDAAVEIHIALCRSCRRIAEALRPEGSITQECLIPEESRSLPYYWGIAIPPDEERPEFYAEEAARAEPVRKVKQTERAVPAEQGTLVATARGYRSRRRRRHVSMFDGRDTLAHLSGWQLAIAVLMGAVLGTALRLLGYADGNEVERASYRASNARPAPVAVERTHVAVALPTNARQQLAAKLGVAPACWQDQPGELHGNLAAGQVSEFDLLSRNADLCCTKCHNATAPRFALRGTTARISRSCQVCHWDVPVGSYNRPSP